MLSTLAITNCAAMAQDGSGQQGEKTGRHYSHVHVRAACGSEGGGSVGFQGSKKSEEPSPGTARGLLGHLSLVPERYIIAPRSACVLISYHTKAHVCFLCSFRLLIIIISFFLLSKAGGADRWVLCRDGTGPARGNPVARAPAAGGAPMPRH